MTSSTDRYTVLSGDPAGYSLGMAIRCLAERREEFPAVSFGLYQLGPCDDSGNPLPTPEDPERGEGASESPTAGKACCRCSDLKTALEQVREQRNQERSDLAVANIRIASLQAALQADRSRDIADAKAARKAVAGTSDNPMRAYRGDDGWIYVGHEAVAGPDDTRADIQRLMALDTTHPYDKAQYAAALAFLDGEEAEKATPLVKLRTIRENVTQISQPGGKHTCDADGKPYTDYTVRLNPSDAEREPGVWITYPPDPDQDQYRRITIHASQLDALSEVNRAAINCQEEVAIAAIHLPYGTTLEEATK